MARFSLSILGAIAASTALVTLAALTDGCGSIPCSENDKCQGSDAAPAVEDQSVVVDVGADGGDESDASDASDAPADVSIDNTVDDADAQGDVTTDTVTVDGPVGDVVTADAEGGSPDASDGGDAGPDADAGDGCVPHAEICNNGIDDDCNGKIDCADPACQPQFQCVPTWNPTGWTAPVVLYDDTIPGGPAPTPGPCAAPYGTDVLDGHDTPVTGNAGCACSCGSVQGASCSPPFVTVYTSTSCSMVGSWFSASLPVSGCNVVESSQGGINTGQILDAGVPSGGSCTAIVTPSIPAWDAGANTAWAGTGRACQLTTPRPYSAYYQGAAGGCDAGYTCVEAPPGTFPHACLMAAGHQTCPTGYSDTHRYFDGGTDTRACPANGCSCNAPTGLQCTPSVVLHSDGGCGGTSYPITSTCTSFNNIGANAGVVSAQVTPGMTTGSCTPDAGSVAVTGGVAANTGETTVCCVP
jgi:hypothetical protein